jgi:AraC-like DNA-binding protein
MNRLVFSSDELPAELGDEARFKLWRDLYCARFGEADITRAPDGPFFAHCLFMQIGAVGLTRFDISLHQFARTPRQVAADSRDDFIIGFNRGAPAAFAQHGREIVDASQVGLFYTNGEPSFGSVENRATVVGLCVPRPRVLDLVPDAEDLVAKLLDPSNEATRYLNHYAEFLLASGDSNGDGTLAERIEWTLLDLIALALGAHRDAAELARMRGLRAARVQAIVAEIKRGFSDPAFSAHTVAAKLGIAAHYVQNLLGETGASFTERVLELRLQKARAMLSDPDHDRFKISEIAYACGFNEVSYFNRCFRRRFGASPTQYRGNGQD